MMFIYLRKIAIFCGYEIKLNKKIQKKVYIFIISKM